MQDTISIPVKAVLYLLLAAANTLSPARAENPSEAATTDALEAAPTAGFFAMPSGEFVSVVLQSNLTDIQRLNLPEGNYIVNASAVLATYSDTPLRVFCSLMVGGINRGELAMGVVGGTGGDVMTTLPLTAGMRLASREDVAIACTTDEPGLVWSQPSPITAIRVDRLTIVHGSGLEPP